MKPIASPSSPAASAASAARRERVAHALVLAVALGVDPVVGQAVEHRAADERQRLDEPALAHERVERARVDPHVRRQADPVARRLEVAVAERAAQLGQRRAQAAARALVEHLRPQRPGHLAARVQARVQRQPAEQAAEPAPPGRRERLAVELERQLAEHPDAEHRGQP